MPYRLETPEQQPAFQGPEELARHQAENLRRAIGDELWEWLSLMEEDDET